jgi:CheY-like chemotaxis protein
MQLESQLQRAQKMEAIGTLAGGVAHDLNNILCGVVTYPELLLFKMQEHDPLRKPLMNIKESGEKAARIVQDLLTLARRGVAISEVVDFNHIVKRYLTSPEHAKIMSFHPQVTLEVQLEEKLLYIKGSPVHLSKTLMNVVSNAAESMQWGGVIAITTQNKYIEKPVRGYEDVDEGDYVVLTVSDTGSGISPDDLSRIFEPFYTKKIMGRSGTGLGMSVVWSTIKDHNGYIDVQSAEGKGTTFTLYFPATREALAQPEHAVPLEKLMGKGEKILVVDDVKTQRDIALHMLTHLGYSATTVASGEQAIEHMRSDRADLVILDMIMDPGIDGLETYKKILEIHPGQRAIIVSGYTETERAREAEKLGAAEYVLKPYSIEKLGLAIKKGLASS